MKRVLIITYAVPEELDVLEVRNRINRNKSEWFSKLSRLERLKVRLSRRYYEDEVILLETGIGKVGAYNDLYRVISGAASYLGKETDITVLNLGTTASVEAHIGDVVECNRFVERDLVKICYDTTPRDHTIYLVDGSPKTRMYMETEPFYNTRYSCNSGDSFVTDKEEAYQKDDGWTAVCDMEGFSQAQVIERLDHNFSYPVKFKCIKYITDRIGEDNSIECWEEELPAARLSLTEIADRHISEFYGVKTR